MRNYKRMHDNNFAEEGTEEKGEVSLEINEERKMCRICFEEEREFEMFTPCLCRGSSRYVHRGCLNQWLEVTENEDARKKCLECRYEYRRDEENNRRWRGLDRVFLLAKKTPIYFLCLHQLLVFIYGIFLFLIDSGGLINEWLKGLIHSETIDKFFLTYYFLSLCINTFLSGFLIFFDITMQPFAIRYLKKIGRIGRKKILGGFIISFLLYWLSINELLLSSYLISGYTLFIYRKHRRLIKNCEREVERIILEVG